MTRDEQAGPVGDEPTGPAWSAHDSAPHGGDDTHTEHVGHAGQSAHGAAASTEPGGGDEYDVFIPEIPDSPESLGDMGSDPIEGDVHPDTRRAAEHLDDLRRLQAEYINYKRRVDRDRDVARDQGITQVVEAMLPVLDDIHLAREHGDLDGGPFARTADKLEGVLARFGVTPLGAKGEPFDPNVHEALMHVDASTVELPKDATSTTVVQVLQPGYRMGDRVIRPARVSVADPV